MSYMHIYSMPDKSIPEENKDLYDRVKKAYADKGLEFTLQHIDGYRTKGKATYCFHVKRPFQENEPIDQRLRGPIVSNGLFSISIPGHHGPEWDWVSIHQQEVLSYTIDEALNLALIVINANDNSLFCQRYQFELIRHCWELTDEEKKELKEKLNNHLYPKQV